MALIAHYRLDNNAKDSVGKYDGAVTGAINWVDGKIGVCGDFDKGYIANPAVSDYLHGRPEASIAMWVKNDVVSAASYGLFQLSGFVSSNGNIYPYTTEYNVYLDVFRTDRIGPIIMPKSTLEWHHLVITQSPGVWRVYQDGKLVRESTANQSISTNHLQFELGRNSNSRYHDGQLDDVRVYDHALSEREVRDLSMGLITHLPLSHDVADVAAGVNRVNVNGVQSELGGFQFDGSNSYVDFGNDEHFSSLANNAPITVTCWAYPTSHQSRSQVLSRSIGGGTYTFLFGLINGRMNAYTGTVWRELTTEQVPLNEWSLITWTFDGVTLKGYINDRLIGSRTDYTYTVKATGATRIGGHSSTSDFYGIIKDHKVYTTALTGDQVQELYQQKASIDSLGNIHSHRLLESGYKKPLMPSYEVWADGQSGSVTGFSQNGSTNTRVKAMGPHGNEIVIWKGNSNGANGANAGWNASYFPIDSSKLYRFSVWIRREVQGNGSAYLGCNAQGGHVLTVPGGTTANSNPYFWTGTPGSEWQLVVGHVFPHGYTGPMHPESGRYTKAGRLGNTNRDFAWQTTTASARHRSYLYYASNAATEQHFAYPRVDLCDGTEPTIDELLLGHDLLWSQNGFPKELGISDRGLAVSSMSEIGPARGLVAWYPLDGDVKDYAGNRDGINGGATATADGYQFGQGAQIALPSDVGYTDKVSVFLWFKPTGTSVGGYHTVLGGTGLEISIPSALNHVRTGLHTSGSRKADNYNSPLELNKWHLIGFSYADNKKTVYKNGVSIGTSSVAGDLDPIFSGRVIGSWGSYSTVGLIKDVRLYNRELSPEEVATLYAITNPDSKQNMMVSADTTYAKGQFKEVIA